MAIQPPTDAPFGLQPNIAAGLAWFFGIIGGLIFLFGGGTNKFVKHASAQSIVLTGGYIVVMIAISVVTSIIHALAILSLILIPIIALVYFVVWVYTVIMGFQGKDVTLPIVGPFASQIFASQLA